MQLATFATALLLSVAPIMGQNATNGLMMNDTMVDEVQEVDPMMEGADNDTIPMEEEDMMEDDGEEEMTVDDETMQEVGGDMMTESTAGPSDGTMMDDHSDMMQTITPSEETPSEGDTTGAGGTPETNPPQDLQTEGYSCSVGGVETDTARCTEYKNDLSNINCGCFYFCEGGSLVRCMEDSQTYEFSCGGLQVFQCFENPAAPPVSAAGDEATEDTLHALWATAMTALAAVVCVL